MTLNGGSTPPYLQAEGLTKHFGHILACDDVDLVLRPGEIHGVLGENGAGKSTLMRLIFGLVRPDRGTLKIDGRPCRMSGPAHAVSHGIGMVHQHYSLVESLTVWENVALGEKGRLDQEAAKQIVRDLSDLYLLGIDPDTHVRDLRGAFRQRVELIKCLRSKPRIILLDEPTAVLAPAESEVLYDALSKQVRNRDWSAVLVTHDLDEALRVTDVITVMRDGRVVDRVATAEADGSSLARAMVGRPVSLRTVSARLPASHDSPPVGEAASPKDPSRPVLQIEEASVRGEGGRTLLDALTLEVGPGEIVGVAGVDGNGQTPLADVLAGLLPLDSGTVTVGGRVVPTGLSGAMVDAGLVVIPADRHRQGCALDMTVAENLTLAALGTVQRLGVLRRRAMRRRAEELIGRFDIHPPEPDLPVEVLSGGNQQRVVLARAFSSDPRVLVAHQPTQGLDVGMIEFVEHRLRSAAEEGIGILLLSTDLAEILGMADRIVVIRQGRIIGEMSRSELDIARLGNLIGGVSDEEGAE